MVEHSLTIFFIPNNNHIPTSSPQTHPSHLTPTCVKVILPISIQCRFLIEKIATKHILQKCLFWAPPQPGKTRFRCEASRRKFLSPILASQKVYFWNFSGKDLTKLPKICQSRPKFLVRSAGTTKLTFFGGPGLCRLYLHPD